MVGLPYSAVAVRALGLSFVTSGVLVLLAGLVSVSPVWRYGPSSAGHASAGSQPDWYTGFLDGALRLVPSGWEVTTLGGTVPLAVLIPQAVVGGFVGLIGLWPLLEARVARDRSDHDLLDRPREHPTRTAIGVAGLVFFLILWGAGATDLVTTHFHIAFEHQVVALRVLLVVGPPLAFHLIRKLCVALTANDHAGRESVHARGVLRGSRTAAG